MEGIDWGNTVFDFIEKSNFIKLFFGELGLLELNGIIEVAKFSTLREEIYQNL